MKRIVRIKIDDFEEFGTIGEAFRVWRQTKGGDLGTDLDRLRGMFIAALARDYLDSLRKPVEPKGGGV